jgi:hypothetical protein
MLHWNNRCRQPAGAVFFFIGSFKAASEFFPLEFNFPHRDQTNSRCFYCDFMYQLKNIDNDCPLARPQGLVRPEGLGKFKTSPATFRLVAWHLNRYKSKAVPVTGCGDLYGCEMLRIPHCLDSRLIDGGKAVAPRTGRTLLPRNIIFFKCFRYSFLLEAE